MNFRQNCFLFVYIIIISLITPSDGSNNIVKTSKGRVKGVFMNSKGNTSNRMLVFKGIPYAEPPIGVLRFKAPIPVQKNWMGVKILSEVDKPFCPQPNSFGFTGLGLYDEDCLFVNIYSPSNVTSESKLPVMVWIHGGGFFVGSGQYYSNGPDYLVDQNVIVVTFNYRLGALGFLSFGTDQAPGNAGLKDQSLALKWVNEEISEFGGDPEKVTIFGESVGAASVHYHIISNMSKGLFQRAIGQSGTNLAGWAFLSTGYEERAKQFAAALNCTANEDGINMTCLQNTNVENILNRQSIGLPEEMTIPGNIITYLPVVETTNSETRFLSDIPKNLLKDPVNKVPILMGINKDEGIQFIPSNAEFYESVLDKIKYFIPKTTRDQINNYTLNEKIKKIKNFYFNDSKPSLENLQGYINLMTDKMFSLSTAASAQELSKHSNIYLYHFDFDGNFRLPSINRKLLNLTGVSHGDELGYLFVMSLVNTEGYAADSAEMQMLQKMVKIWTNFAKFGMPIQDNDDPGKNSTQWPPISENQMHYMVMNGDLTISTDNFHQLSVEFWKDIESAVNVSPSPITPALPTTPATTPTKVTSSSTAAPTTTVPTMVPTTPSPTTVPTTPVPTTVPTTPNPTTVPTAPVPTTVPTTPNTPTVPPTQTTIITNPTTINTPPAPTIPPTPSPSHSTCINFNIFTFGFTAFVILNFF